MEQYYQKLMQISLASDNVSELLSALYRCLQLGCFCLNNRYELVAHRLGCGSGRSKVEEAIKVLHTCGRGAADAESYFQVENMHVFCLQGRVRNLGFLVCLDKGQLSERSKLFCRQTASFVALKLRDKAESYQHEYGNLWRRFLAGEYQGNIQDFGQELAEFGLNTTKGLTLLFLDNREENLRLTGIIEQQVGSSLTFVYAEKLLMLIPGMSQAQRSHWCEAVENYWRQRRSSSLIVLAPGVRGLEDLMEAYLLGRNAYKFLKKYAFQGIRQSTEYLGVNLLLSGAETPEYKYLRRQIVQPLQDYDEKQKANLMETLLQALYSPTLEGAAKSLHIHINTLRYRLTKVEELTGRNFFNTRDRYTLLVACMPERVEYLAGREQE